MLRFSLSIGLLLAAVVWSLPKATVADFHAGGAVAIGGSGKACVIRVGTKKCSTVGDTECKATKTACRVDDAPKKAATCKDEAGNVSGACEMASDVCKADKNAEYDSNCDPETVNPAF